MAMFNDVDWRKKGKSTGCFFEFRTGQELRKKRSPRGHWSFLGPGQEENGMERTPTRVVFLRHGRASSLQLKTSTSAELSCRKVFRSFGISRALVGHLENVCVFLWSCQTYLLSFRFDAESHLGWSSPRNSIQPALGRITSCMAPPCLRSGGILESIRVSNSVQKIVGGHGRSIFDFSAAASGPATGMSVMSTLGALQLVVKINLFGFGCLCECISRARRKESWRLLCMSPAWSVPSSTGMSCHGPFGILHETLTR